MEGQGGDDHIIVELGNSGLAGGAGSDVFEIRANDTKVAGDVTMNVFGTVTNASSTNDADYFVFDSNDFVQTYDYQMTPAAIWARIKDFDPGEDKIAILNGTGGVNSISDLTITPVDGNTEIYTSSMAKIILEGFTGTLTASDFIFGDGSTGGGSGSGSTVGTASLNDTFRSVALPAGVARRSRPDLTSGNMDFWMGNPNSDAFSIASLGDLFGQFDAVPTRDEIFDMLRADNGAALDDLFGQLDNQARAPEAPAAALPEAEQMVRISEAQLGKLDAMINDLRASRGLEGEIYTAYTAGPYSIPYMAMRFPDDEVILAREASVDRRRTQEGQHVLAALEEADGEGAHATTPDDKANLARKVAMIRQDLATFGVAESGESEKLHEARRDMLDYFAA
jgi:hypothetical protein